ncbi:hypothetical protein ABG067_002358 [Albugo candida]
MRRNSAESHNIPSARFFGKSFDISDEEQQRQCELAEKEHLPNLIRQCTLTSMRNRGWKEVKKTEGLTVWEKGGEAKPSGHGQASSYQVRSFTRVHSSLDVLQEILSSSVLTSYRSYLRILYKRLIARTTILSHYERLEGKTSDNFLSKQLISGSALLRLCWMAFNSPVPTITALEMFLFTYTKKLAPDALGPIGSMNQKEERRNDHDFQEKAPAAFQILWTSTSTDLQGISNSQSLFIPLAGFLLYPTNHQEMTDIVFYASAGEQKDVSQQNVTELILRKMAWSIRRFSNAVNAWKWNQQIKSNLHSAQHIWSRADLYLQCQACLCLFEEFAQRKHQCFICAEFFCRTCTRSGIVDLPATGITNAIICKCCQHKHCGKGGGKLPFYSKQGQSNAKSSPHKIKHRNSMEVGRAESTTSRRVYENKSFERSKTFAASSKQIKKNQPKESKYLITTPATGIPDFASVSEGVFGSQQQARLRIQTARSPGRFVNSAKSSFELTHNFAESKSSQPSKDTHSTQNPELSTLKVNNQLGESVQHVRLVPSPEVFLTSLQALCQHATEALKCRYGAVSIVQFDGSLGHISLSLSHYMYVRKHNRLIPTSEKMGCCLPILENRSKTFCHDVRDTCQSPCYDFLQLPIVKGPQAVRFYAGVPLTSSQRKGSDELLLGAISVFDPIPRRRKLRDDSKCAVLQHLAITFAEKNFVVLSSPLVSNRRGSSSCHQGEIPSKVDSSQGKNSCIAKLKGKAQEKICKADYTSMTLNLKRQQECVQ